MNANPLPDWYHLPLSRPVPYETPQLSSREGDLPSMIARQSMVFRVYDSDSYTVLNEHGFVAGYFARDRDFESVESVRSLEPDTEDFVIKGHIRHWQLRANGGSEWISTSPLWSWAIMECARRVQRGSTGVGLAVIDVRSLKGGGREPRRIYYGHELTIDPTARQWTNNPQEILIHGIIPRECIISQASYDEDIRHVLPPPFFEWDNPDSGGHRLLQGVYHPPWSWFLTAQQDLIANFSLPERYMYATQDHAEAACDLAFALLRKQWQKALVVTLLQRRNIYEIMRTTYWQGSFGRDINALSKSLEQLSIQVELLAIHAKEASRTMESAKSVVRKLAGKIASWAWMIDWSRDVKDKCWNRIENVIESTIEAKEAKDLQDLSRIEECLFRDGGY